MSAGWEEQLGLLKSTPWLADRFGQEPGGQSTCPEQQDLGPWGGWHLTGPVTCGQCPRCHPAWHVRSVEYLCFAQTRTYLNPEEVLKGLQGETEEVLNGISLSVNILKELYWAYDFCCANMRLFFKVRLHLQARQGGSEAVGASARRFSAGKRVRRTHLSCPSLSPLERQRAGALGIPFLLCIFQNEFLLPSHPDH